MKKFLVLILSLLMVITTFSGSLVGLTAVAESSVSSIDLIDANLWNKNQLSQYMSIIETTEDGFSAIKVSITQYNAYNIKLNLKTDTYYSLIFDIKSPLKFENIQIWPTKCGAGPSSNGSIVWDTENYTASDCVLFKGGYDGTNNLSKELGHTTYNNRYKNNAIYFSTVYNMYKFQYKFELDLIK